MNELDTMTAAMDDSKALYFTFDEGNNELAILKVAADKAALLDTSEFSHYGGRWEGPMGFAAVMNTVEDFIAAEVMDITDADEELEVDLAWLRKYSKLLDTAEIIDGFDAGTSIWELRGEDDDNSVSIDRDDVEALLQAGE